MAGPTPTAPTAPAPTLSPTTSAYSCDAKGRRIEFRFSFDEGVPAQDRAHVRRGARLGRKAFDVRNTFCFADEVGVHVLGRDGPKGRRFSAYSYEGEITVYAESEDWRTSPLPVRLETMLHEMYHVAQYYWSQEPDPRPQWLLEGSAVWAAATTAVRLRLYPSYDAAVGAVYLEADPSSLRRAETNGGWAELGRPYALAFRATEALLAGRGGLERLEAYWEAVRADNEGWSTSLSTNAEWKLAFRRTFGVPIARFYARLERLL